MFKIIFLVSTLVGISNISLASENRNVLENPCSKNYLGPKMCIRQSISTDPEYLALQEAINSRVDEIVLQSSLPGSNLLNWHKRGMDVEKVSHIFKNDEPLVALVAGLEILSE
ncbi:MAG: hypothetical protein CL677_05215 [Bdellovibrionaceae bacterium]|nr:hypothetical protein [Pseudobdellovibrionaceae bacterium]|tara:strand:+ start:87 stop:425 length:339 start_codon:yes stop_codon:yes gene_type:complete